MNLIVETGMGVPNANSYVELDEAQDYVSAFSDVTLTNRSIIEATRQTDALYGHRYRGKLAGQPGVDQGLLFPRTEFTTSQGFNIPAETIPKQLKNFVCHIAALLEEDEDQGVINDQAGVKSFRNAVEGVVSEQVEYFAPRNVRPHDEYVNMIAPILQSNQASGFTVYQRTI